MTVYAASLTSVHNGLGKLRSRRPRYRDGPLLVSVFVSQLSPTIAAFRAGHASALEHHYRIALNDAQRGFRLFARASAKTKAYGFPARRVCQSGR